MGGKPSFGDRGPAAYGDRPFMINLRALPETGMEQGLAEASFSSKLRHYSNGWNSSMANFVKSSNPLTFTPICRQVSLKVEPLRTCPISFLSVV